MLSYDDPNIEADLGVYRSTYGLPPCTYLNGCLHKVNPCGAAEAEEKSVKKKVRTKRVSNCREEVLVFWILGLIEQELAWLVLSAGYY